MLHEISENNGKGEIWCGDFNVRNSLWGGEGTDSKRRGSRRSYGGISIRLSKCSILLRSHLGLRRYCMSKFCDWNVLSKSNISDHYPILFSENCRTVTQEGTTKDRKGFIKPTGENLKNVLGWHLSNHTPLKMFF